MGYAIKWVVLYYYYYYDYNYNYHYYYYYYYYYNYYYLERLQTMPTVVTRHYHLHTQRPVIQYRAQHLYTPAAAASTINKDDDYYYYF